jgi:hypothetical protein
MVTSLVAFHSLFAKNLPVSSAFSSNLRSCPVGVWTMQKRTLSAPYFSIIASGSGELPSDLRHLATLLVAH